MKQADRGRWTALVRRMAVLPAVCAALVTAVSLAPPAESVALAGPPTVTAVQVQLPAGAEYGQLNSVDCPRSGWCEAGGTYTDSTGRTQAMVVTESAGHWGQATELTMPSGSPEDPFAYVNAVSSIACSAPRACVAVGEYGPEDAVHDFIVTQAHGTWGSIRQAVLPAHSPAGTPIDFTSVACPAPGACVAVGDLGVRPVVVTEKSGRWERAQFLRPPAHASQGLLLVHAVACSRVGACVAVGDYTGSRNRGEAATVTESGGVWRQGAEVALPRDAQSNPLAHLSSVTCTGRGSCVAVGSYLGALGYNRAMVVTESAGRWEPGRQISAEPEGAMANSVPRLNAVGCAQSAKCVAAGTYQKQADENLGMAVLGPARGWRRPVGILPPPNLAPPGGGLASVSCVRGGTCTVVGEYTDNSDREEPMAAAVEAS